MKVAILAGGLGTRLREETEYRPKPMVEIGGRPILWHIMKLYAHYGWSEFVVCLGYKGDLIRDYFQNYVKLFREKPQVQGGWINGGFFVFERAVLELIESDNETLEVGLLVKLAESEQLSVYQHEGFWQCMDTYREMQLLNDLWRTGRAPWALWRH